MLKINTLASKTVVLVLEAKICATLELNLPIISFVTQGLSVKFRTTRCTFHNTPFVLLPESIWCCFCFPKSFDAVQIHDEGNSPKQTNVKSATRKLIQAITCLLGCHKKEPKKGFSKSGESDNKNKQQQNSLNMGNVSNKEWSPSLYSRVWKLTFWHPKLNGNLGHFRVSKIEFWYAVFWS